MAIPDADFGFRELIAAQATGDVLTLRDHGLPAERVVLEGPDTGAGAAGADGEGAGDAGGLMTLGIGGSACRSAS